MEEKTGVSLAAHTTMRVGGTASLLLEVADRTELMAALASYPDHLILGGGSNLVFPDGVYGTAIISTAKMPPETTVHYPPASSPPAQALVHAGAGCTTNGLVDFCLENHLGGLEKFAGLPGTVGGALVMNARCYDTQMSFVVAEVEFAAPGSAAVTVEALRAEEWGYKKSPFQPGRRLAGAVVLGATFRVTPVRDVAWAAAREKAAWCRADRVAKGHFRLPSAGSVFKNNRAFNSPTGQIIDELGLRGKTLGGAQVAPWHGNIIVNTGTATAAEVRSLVELVEAEVLEKRGVHLEREVILL